MQNDKQILEKMLQYAQKVADYTKGMDYDLFEKNDMAVDACVFNLSKLGETSNQISEEFEEGTPDIPWRQLYGLRNRIVHDYEGINLKLVWEIIQGDIPDLIEKITRLI